MKAGFSFLNALASVFICMLLTLPFQVHAGSKIAPTQSSSAQGIVRPAKSIQVATHPVLDTAKVRKLYLSGDFDEAIAILDSGLKEKRAFNHIDSVFIFKHLGVMYAAKYETREKGKLYMYQLLMTEPTAKIMDMYASDMIYMIFKNIQDEFDTNRGGLSKANDPILDKASLDASRSPKGKGTRTKTGEQPGINSSDSHAAYWWVGGAVLAVGITGGVYFYSQQPASTGKEKEIVVR